MIQEQTMISNPLLGLGWLWRDLKFALRQLRRSPRYATASILTLALGIGAAAAMFTVVDHTLLQPFPYKDSGRLVQIQETGNRARIDHDVPWLDIKTWRARNHSFQGIAFTLRLNGSKFLIGKSRAVLIRAYKASPNLFDVLGVQPELGRGFASGTENTMTDTIVLSDAIWRAEFDSDRNILGKAVRINNTAYTIVGIMPPGFIYPEGSLTSRADQVWVSFRPGVSDQDRNEGPLAYRVVARLKQNVNLDSARSEMAVIQKQIAAGYSDPRNRESRTTVNIRTYADVVVSIDVRRALLALLMATSVLWIIANMNATSLFLARVTVRQREIAMRGALGAPRWRLAQQMIVEGLVTSTAAALLGSGLAFASVKLLAHELRANLPVPISARPDTLILIALVGITIASGVISVAWPIVLTTRTPIESALRASGLPGGADRQQHRLRHGLVILEVALSLTLLVICGMLLATIYRLRRVPLGYRTNHILVASLTIPSYRYQSESIPQALYEPLLEKVKRLHGVQSAGLISEVPLGSASHLRISMRKNGRDIIALLKPVSPDVQRVFGLKMVAGRFFDSAEDTPTSEPVAVVNLAFAREYAPNIHDVRSIVGSKFIVLRKDGASSRIIGVLGNQRQVGIVEESQPEIDVCLCQVTHASRVYGLSTVLMDIAIRTQGSPAQIVPELRDVLQRTSPEFANATISTMDQIVQDSYGSERLAARILELFGVSALLISVMGLYGLLAYLVAQRTQELGVRIALGAQTSELMRLVLRQATVLLLIGIAFGIGASLAALRIVHRFLYGAGPKNIWPLVGGSAVLLFSGLLAAYLPARRAAKIDPVKALRGE